MGRGGRSGARLGEVSLAITHSEARHGGNRENDVLVLGLGVPARGLLGQPPVTCAFDPNPLVHA